MGRKILSSLLLSLSLLGGCSNESERVNVLVEDMNGDGLKDIVYSTLVGNRYDLKVAYQAKDGTFSSRNIGVIDGKDDPPYIQAGRTEKK